MIFSFFLSSAVKSLLIFLIVLRQKPVQYGRQKIKLKNKPHRFLTDQEKLIIKLWARKIYCKFLN